MAKTENGHGNGVIDSLVSIPNQHQALICLYCICSITPRHVTSLRCPSPRYSAKATQLVNVEAMVNIVCNPVQDLAGQVLNTRRPAYERLPFSHRGGP